LSKGLVIVESPAKAKTIQKYLGKGFTVEASLGHVKDLPKSTLGVDIENDFGTDYVVIPGKEKVLAKLKKLALSADHIYLAPDPDREGEAIAAHLAVSAASLSTKSPSARCRKLSNILAPLIAIWWTPSRRVVYSTASSAIRFRRCYGTKYAVVCPPAVYKPSRFA
jgi:DNA topoisomerase-1